MDDKRVIHDVIGLALGAEWDAVLTRFSINTVRAHPDLCRVTHDCLHAVRSRPCLQPHTSPQSRLA